MKRTLKSRPAQSLASHRLFTLAACSLVAASLVSACGKKDAEEAVEDEVAAGGAAAIAPLAVDNLALLPDASLLLKSEAAKASLVELGLRGSSDASNGTPPEMRSIGAESMETYLTGSIDDFIAEVEAARDAAQAAQGDAARTAWDAVQAKVKTFRQAQAKCRVLEDTVRQVSDLSQQTASMCYMSKIGAKGVNILAHKSGEKLADGEFFSPDETKDVIRKIEIRVGQVGLALEGEEGGGGGMNEDIYFRIPKASADSYTVELNFCNPTDGSMRSVESIVVDKVKGTMTFSHVGDDTNDSGSNKHVASLVAALQQDAEGKLSFDFAKPREVNAKSQGTFSNGEMEGSHTFNGRFTVEGDVLTSVMFMQGTHAFGGNSHTFVSKNASQTRFTGTKMRDVRVFEGAGRMQHTGTGEFNGQSQSFTHDQKVAFEYDVAATPRYKSVTTNDYLASVDKVFADKDKEGSIIAGTAPKAPDVSELTKAKAICKSTPSSVYTLGASSTSLQGFMKVEKSCSDGRGFDRRGGLCDALQARENDIMQVLWQRKQSGN